ncbi:hypothetical protein E3N88_32064 [Mikania micrantha]|uniref:Uncharacterized protein n=1 Tax=Mikania micrantha TaxID=192012 RepID=A0A5N6M7D5_9ASTR|nr:hypothetical protein E3N88_32064 [Mikania micrantha]
MDLLVGFIVRDKQNSPNQTRKEAGSWEVAAGSDSAACSPGEGFEGGSTELDKGGRVLRDEWIGVGFLEPHTLVAVRDGEVEDSLRYAMHQKYLRFSGFLRASKLQGSHQGTCLQVLIVVVPSDIRLIRIVDYCLDNG